MKQAKPSQQTDQEKTNMNNLSEQERSTESQKNEQQEPILSSHEAAQEQHTMQAIALQEQVAILENALAETKDQLLRLAADFENYKKRSLKEKADVITYANEELIKALLPVLDDFERALKVLERTESLQDISALRQGIEMVAKNLFSLLQKRGVEVIEALHQPFNSELHEAIGSLPAQEESQKNTVIDVIENGYKFNGKVIRYSKVIIGA